MFRLSLHCPWELASNLPYDKSRKRETARGMRDEAVAVQGTLAGECLARRSEQQTCAGPHAVLPAGSLRFILSRGSSSLLRSIADGTCRLRSLQSCLLIKWKYIRFCMTTNIQTTKTAEEKTGFGRKSERICKQAVNDFTFLFLSFCS